MANRRNAGSRYLELSEPGAAKTGAILGFLMWLVGFLWHGMFGQPSMIGALYSMPYMQPMLLFTSLFGLVFGGLILGWLGAYIYNRMIKSG